MKEEISICGYSPDRGIDYYASGLAGILREVVGPEQRSTHTYVKEVRKALEVLVFTAWDKAEEYIPILAESNIPDSIRSARARECFKELLIGLLRRFRETSDRIPIGARIKLMNMIITSIAEMARYGPPQAGERIVSYVFSSSESSHGNRKEGGEHV